MDSLALLSWVRPGGRSLGYIWQPVGQGFPNETRHHLSRMACSSDTDCLTLEEEGPTFLRNVGEKLPIHTASYPRTPIPRTTSHLGFSCNVPHTCFAKPAIYFSVFSLYFIIDFHARIFTTFVTKVRDSSVFIVTRLRADRPRRHDFVHSTGSTFSSPDRPDYSRGRPILLSNGYWWSLPAVKQTVREADLSRMRVRGARTPLTLASSCWENYFSKTLDSHSSVGEVPVFRYVTPCRLRSNSHLWGS